MLNRRLALLGALAPLAARAQQPDPLREFFRMIELDSRSAVLEALLRGMDPNVLAPNGQRPLHWALMHESGQALDGLLADPRTDVEAENASGERPLMLAALRGRLAWAQLLVRHGAAVEPKRGQKTWGALHYACSGPDQGVSTWLLDQGADINARSENGSTPLMMAFGYGSLDSADVLLKRGADTTLRNDLGLDAWDFARKAGRSDAAQRMGLRPTSVSEKP
ncbi:ankyrin repeat domain-containing protein [Inhella proteolytica]|uniref:Ankyrin repeat domain-containing protein n=1 Tax=Inhella proteolytica TaxID=2795029 RepID=A0A931IZ12_9BURK|nr:ankyrin repeat domain-containing protein [Inhella proteolytica]MBH9575648.1 ankyrin repeat domain-containing protein [Inhella proteolytica]